MVTTAKQARDNSNKHYLGGDVGAAIYEVDGILRLIEHHSMLGNTSLHLKEPRPLMGLTVKTLKRFGYRVRTHDYIVSRIVISW
jgi:HD superfamily phosphodiesterase